VLTALFAVRLVVVDQVDDHVVSVEIAPHRAVVVKVSCLEQTPREGERLLWHRPRRPLRPCPLQLASISHNEPVGSSGVAP